MARILVVDDDASIRAVIRAILEVEGHQVAEADDGIEAMARIKRQPPDLVLLDIMMPGMDGYQVLARIQELPSRRDVPVVVVTALHHPEEVARELQGGAVDHVAKPFDASVLLAAVDHALQAPAAVVEERRRVLSQAAEVYEAVGALRELVAAASQPRGGGTTVTVDIPPQPRRRWLRAATR